MVSRVDQNAFKARKPIDSDVAALAVDQRHHEPAPHQRLRVTDPVTVGSPTGRYSAPSSFGLFASTSLAVEKQHSIKALTHRIARRVRLVRFDIRTIVAT